MSKQISKSVAIIGTRGYPSYYGGFETALRKLAPFLASTGWSVTVYGRKGWVKKNDGQDNNLIRSVITWGVASRALSTLTHSFTATVHALVRRPDVVLIMNVANGIWLPLLWAARIPTLVHVDGIEWERGKWGTLARTMFKLGALFTQHLAVGLVYDAHEIARIWGEKFRRNGFYIAYGGDTRPTLPAPAGLIPGQYALLVARLVPENSIDNFLLALNGMRDTTVVIVGSSGNGGALEERVRVAASKSDSVRWLGHVQDDDLLFALWQNAGAYFHGHTVGGTNPALVQAMALGVPTVAVDTPFNREVLGEAGILTSSSPEAIAANIIDLLANPDLQSRLSKLALKRAQDHFSWAEICARYDNALEVTMRQRRWRIWSDT